MSPGLSLAVTVTMRATCDARVSDIHQQRPMQDTASAGIVAGSFLGGVIEAEICIQ